MAEIVDSDHGFRVRQPDGQLFPAPDQPPLLYRDALLARKMTHHRDQLDLHGGGRGKATVMKGLRSFLWHKTKRALPPVGHAATAMKAMQLATAKTTDVAEEDRLLAKASKLAYMSYTDREGLDPENLLYQVGLSTPETALWTPKNNSTTAIIAFRGSAEKADILTDGYLAVGTLSSSARFRETRRTLAKMDQRFGYYGGTPVYLTGHSLGGGLAHEFAPKFPNGIVVSFNPGVGAAGLPAANNKLGRVYSVHGDIVSGLAPLSGANHTVMVMSPNHGSRLDAMFGTDPLSQHGNDQFASEPAPVAATEPAAAAAESS